MADPPPDGSRRALRGGALSVAALAGCVLTYAISQTMVIPALPAIGRDFDVGTSTVAWIVSGFFVASAVCTGISGRLGDIFGRRRMLLASMLVFGTGALVSAFATSFVVLAGARIVMGAGAGVVPLAHAITRDVVDGSRTSRAMGTVAMMIGLGAGIGLLLGGVIVDHTTWRVSFATSTTLSLVAVLAVVVSVPVSPTRSTARVDLIGAVGLAVGLGTLLIAVSNAADWGWTDRRIIGIGLSGLAVLVGWVFVESRTVDPIVDLRLLRRRPVLLTNSASFLMGAGQVAVSILVVQLAQLPRANGGLGAPATRAGMLLIPYAITMVVGANVAGRALRWMGTRLALAIGALMSASGLVGLAFGPVDSVSLAAWSGFSGFGIAMTLVVAPYQLVQFVDQVDSGAATGTNAIARSVGQALGTQVTSTVISASAPVVGRLPDANGYARAFVLSAVWCALAGCSAGFLPRLRRGAG